MPRIARQQSETGIYHVFLRGINRGTIFEDTEDFSRFLNTISNAKGSDRFALIGYCLMSNHIHLLIQTGDEELGQSIKRIAGGYAAWFNWKYDRVGHLFQSRFGSEPIETEGYLLAALRYIHNNPVKAKLCRLPEQYEYSSYLDYLNKGTGLTDTALVKEMASASSSDWTDWFVSFSQAENEDCFLDYSDQLRLTDAMLRQRIAELPGLSKANKSGMPDNQDRDDAIRVLKQDGFGLRQLARVTGIPYGIIRSR